MTVGIYPIALVLISAFVMALEALMPWRKEQRQFRRTFASDFLHLAFNGHFLGVILYGISERFLAPLFRDLATIEIAAGWPLWLQIPVVIIGFDLIQWCIHNLLHRVPLL